MSIASMVGLSKSSVAPLAVVMVWFIAIPLLEPFAAPYAQTGQLLKGLICQRAGYAWPDIPPAYG